MVEDEQVLRRVRQGCRASGPRIRTRLGSAVMVHLLTGTVPVEEASIRLRNYVELVITHPVRAGRMQPSPLPSA